LAAPSGKRSLRAPALVCKCNIGTGAKPLKVTAFFSVAKIKRDAALAFIEHIEHRAGLPAARNVPLRRFDLDHLGSEHAEMPAGERPDNSLRSLHHAHAGQWSFGAHYNSPLSRMARIAS